MTRGWSLRHGTARALDYDLLPELECCQPFQLLAHILGDLMHVLRIQINKSDADAVRAVRHLQPEETAAAAAARRQGGAVHRLSALPPHSEKDGKILGGGG